MRMRPTEKPFIVLLVKRCILFLFLMTLLCLFLYGVGTVQDFLASTQSFLLGSVYRLALALCIGSAYGVALDLFFAFRLGSTRLVWGAFFYLLMMAFAAASVLFGGGLLVLIAGNAASAR